MIGALIFVSLAVVGSSQGKPVDKAIPQPYQLRYFQGEFILRKDRDAWRVRVPPLPPAPVTSIAYRRNDCWAVWDERGLTIRVGDKLTSSKLEAIARSPRIFPHAELVDSLEKMKKGERSAFASGIGGSRRLGNYAYFVPRWLNKSGAIWLEALVRVDMTKSNPKPELVARIPGTTLFRNVLDKWLVADDAGLALPVTTPEGWSILRIQGEQIFPYPQDGTLLDLVGDRYIQKLPNNLFQYGSLDWKTPKLTMFYESRLPLAFTPVDPDLLLSQTETRSTAMFLPTGAQWDLPSRSMIDAIGPFLLAYRVKNGGGVTEASVFRRGTGEKLAAWMASPKK
jgi:hypothetical protein